MAGTIAILKWALLGVGIIVTVPFLYVTVYPMFHHYLISAQKEDPYNIATRLVFTHSAHSCMMAPCDASGWEFKITNDKPIEFLGLSLCDTSMIGRGQLLFACSGGENGHETHRGSLPHPNSNEIIPSREERLAHPGSWAGGTYTCPQACEIGDNVNIKVKVAPATVKVINGSESWSYDASQAKWIDLGESKIIEID